MDEDNKVAVPGAAPEDEGARVRRIINRAACAASGRIGRLLAKGTKAALAVLEIPADKHARVYALVSEGSAFVLAAFGAPEGAISIVSSMASHIETCAAPTPPNAGATCNS